MELIVDIDHGIAVNESAIAALLRDKRNPGNTIVVLVSGKEFVANVPLTKMVEMLKKGLPPEEMKESLTCAGSDSGVGIQV
ncbi:hypothetical protein SMZ63_002770 [Cronobacter sakazakii]|uniref:hypothetical protein n=1 Tax=Cronobacter sakazakii TaxID=28141 RepID=UPI001AEB2CCF|nr:hypothetical protein [Cronobacter sakazakii]ELY2671830.1 hypothetical protein [Cronobacter sakazakii]ELY4456196.1 hypothetical protein [Cronobacter sakazakii]ELY4597405.1 hypothetical protein [Cronobacter sakazakii]MDK1086510.1 hypothetical protein [Cronobacter sakazakii]MDK1095599.1 hypothetical protein [Cronobacter sakazakii]